MAPSADDRLPHLERAISEARSLLATNPTAALGKACEIIADRPNAKAMRLVAEAQRRLGNIEQAQAAELLAIQAAVGHPRLTRAAQAQQQGRWEEAAEIASEHLTAEPDDLLALTILAELALSNKRLRDAENLIERVIERAPGFTQARLIHGRSLMLQCRHSEAIDMLETWLSGRPSNEAGSLLFAQVLADAGRFEQAAAVYEQLVRSNEQDANAWLNYALALRFADRKVEAKSALRHAIAIDPSYGAPWWTLANMAPETLSAADMQTMMRQLTQSKHVPDASHLHVAMGIIFDRARDYALAYEHFATGKGLRAQASAYSPGDLSVQVDASISSFSEAFYGDRAGWGSLSSSPIFVIGMPRSGSTLVERILGRHSGIEAAGELPIIPRLIDELDAKAGGKGRHRELVARLDADRVRELGELYTRRSREFRRTDKPFFTDKLHMNWRDLGLIRLILPNARVIDVRRGPVDCCWSNFRTLFASGHPASDDLSWIGHFYREYVRFVEHMAGLVRDDLLSVSYEAVVDDIEIETRRMLSYLDLEFEPACLDFHRLADLVATASVEQVRRPLNREGIGRWKPYRQWLAPLFKALGPLAVPELETDA